MSNYDWIDNPTENGVAVCDTDVLNECLMHLKYNNQKIKSTLNSFNSGNINSNGNSELFDFTAPTEINLTIAETYTINIPTSDYYSVKLVGGGGDGRTALNIYGTNTYSYGGSGAAFVGEVFLNAGFHNLIVGGANSSSILYDENGNALITANGGNNGGSDYGGATNGAGGVLTISPDAQTQNVTVQSNGGTGVNGSKYNNYGQGGYGNSNSNRTDGYFSIVLPSAINNISYKVGGSYPALTGTLASGEQFTLNGLNSDDITGLADGSYIKYVGSDGSSELLNGVLTVAKTVPSTPADNDVWINNSVSPLSVKKYVAPNYSTSTPAPVISSDGIMTGADSRYISYTGLDFTSAQSFKICGSFNCSGSTGYNQYIIGGGGFTYGLYIYLNTGYVAVNLSSNGTSFDIWQTGGVYQITYGQKYWYEIEFTGTQYKINYSTDGTNYTNISTINSSSINPLLINSFINYIGNSSDAARYFNGEIDLKDFKVYIDDVLVFTPDINTGWQDYDKVPLGKITLSSGTITEAKTFPYNIDYIGNNIIETYQNGADWYRVYADGFCVQGSGETISSTYSASAKVRNLLKSFKDTDYTVLISLNTTGASEMDSGYVTVKEKTTADFTTYFNASCSWVAYGYVN